jgi:biotin carboxylase
MSAERLLIVGAGPAQHYIYREAKNLGLYLLAIDNNPKSECFKLADEYKEISIYDIQKIINFAQEKKIDGIASISIEKALAPVSKVAAAMGLPHIPLQFVQTSTNKAEMRRIWRENGLSIPDFWVFNDVNTAIREITKLSLPIIIKPVDNAAKRGLTKIESKQQVEGAVLYAFTNSPSSMIIAEEFIHGKLIFAATYLFENSSSIVSVIDQKYTDNFVQTQFLAPSLLDTSVIKNVTDLAQTAVKVLGAKRGPFHTEIIVNPDRGPVLIETSPRLSYATAAITQLTSGFNPVKQVIYDALSWRRFASEASIARSAILTHVSPVAGTKFKGGSINSLLANNSYSVHEITPLIEAGSMVHQFKTNEDRVLYFVLYGNNRESLLLDSIYIQNLIENNMFG